MLAGGFEVGALHAKECDCPKLLPAGGRPQPEGAIPELLRFKLPFDRHDWIVDGVDGREACNRLLQREAADQTPVAMHLDARPALDSIGAVWDRFYIQGAWTLSGEWLGDRR